MAQATRNITMNIIFLATVFFSCANNSSVTSNDKMNSARAEPPKTRFYYREIGSNDGFNTYTDFLVLENYQNETYSIKQLADIALAYSDTAKTDLPISDVVFVGEKPGTTLPRGMTKSYHLHINYIVASFGFNNFSKENLSKKKKIVDVTLWEKGEPTFIDDDKVDSIVISNIMVNNNIFD